MQLVRGVTPLLADVGAGSKEVLDGVIRKLLEQGVVGPGDPIVVVERLRTDFAIKVGTIHWWQCAVQWCLAL